MPRLRSRTALPPSERPTLLQAVVVMAAIRLCLWVLPFLTVRNLVATWAGKRGERVVIGGGALDRDAQLGTLAPAAG